MVIRKFIALIVFGSMLCTAMPAVTVQASDGGLASIVVTPMLPDNQLHEAGFFYLSVSPGQKQRLELRIDNDEPHEVEVSLAAHTAFSNAYGVTQYDVTEGSFVGLPFSFADIVTLPKESLKIPAHASAVAAFDMGVPEEPFDGELLGGLVVTKMPEEQDPQQASGIRNLYAYVIAVRLRENDRPVEPAFEIRSLAYESYVGIPALVCTLVNPKPLVAKSVALQIELTRAGETEVVYRHENRLITMAPYTQMPYRILLNQEEPLAAGEYAARVHLQYEGQDWHWVETLIVP